MEFNSGFKGLMVHVVYDELAWKLDGVIMVYFKEH